MTGNKTEAKDGYFGVEWQQSSIDPCVYFKKVRDGFGILCAHVDDSFLICTQDSDGKMIRDEFKNAFAKRFDTSPECTSGDEHEYLSIMMKIDRLNGTMTFKTPKLYQKLRTVV